MKISQKTVQKNKPYTCSIGNRGALIDETKKIFELYSQGLSLSEIQHKVQEENILGKRSSEWNANIFKIVKQRYFLNLTPEHTGSLSRALDSILIEQAKNLILYYCLCKYDRLVYDFMTDLAFNKYVNGSLGLSKLDVEAFLNRQQGRHPEILKWTASTRGKLARGLLAALTNFGILRGAKKKEFQKIYLPNEIFLYICYFLKDNGLSSRAIVNSPDFKLFLLDKPDVIFLLSEVTRTGYLEFNYHGNIYNLKFVKNSLKEFVDAITHDITG